MEIEKNNSIVDSFMIIDLDIKIPFISIFIFLKL